VLILAAAGERAFCAGADLKERREMDDAQVVAFLDSFRALNQMLQDMPFPVIAAVDGAAMGGGLELALACDFRVAGPKAVFALPETSLGIIPGAGGTQRLSRLVGLAQARKMILTARRIDARQALNMGLVDELGEESALQLAQGLAREIARNAPVAIRQAKRAMSGTAHLSLAEALDHERSCYLETLKTEDRLEALRAFKEKRAPVFLGR
jgi:enoyl-CoA hydratase/carnithine racemase